MQFDLYLAQSSNLIWQLPEFDSSVLNSTIVWRINTALLRSFGNVRKLSKNVWKYLYDIRVTFGNLEEIVRNLQKIFKNFVITTYSQKAIWISVHSTHIKWINCMLTVDFRYLEPPGEIEKGSNYREFELVTRTLDSSNLSLTRSNFHFPFRWFSIQFYPR